MRKRETDAAAWLAVLLDAKARGDTAAADRARKELARLGVTVSVDRLGDRAETMQTETATLSELATSPNKSRLAFIANRSPQTSDIDIAVLYCEPETCAAYIATDIIMAKRGDPEASIAKPSLSITPDEATELMDELWRCGIRTTGYPIQEANSRSPIGKDEP